MKMNRDESVSINVIDGVLVANIDTELNESILLNVQKSILHLFHSQSILGVVLDLSEVVILDTFIVNKIMNIIESIEFMGGSVIVTGLRPEAVITMVSLDVDLDNLNTALNVDHGIKIIKGIGKNVETENEPINLEETNEQENDIQDTVHE